MKYNSFKQSLNDAPAASLIYCSIDWFKQELLDAAVDRDLNTGTVAVTNGLHFIDVKEMAKPCLNLMRCSWRSKIHWNYLMAIKNTYKLESFSSVDLRFTSTLYRYAFENFQYIDYPVR